MPTICATCYHLIVEPKGAAWYRWLCGAYKLEPEWNPVTGKYDKDEPYAKCKSVNRMGDCSEYREGPNILRPRATTEGEVNEHSTGTQ